MLLLSSGMRLRNFGFRAPRGQPTGSLHGGLVRELTRLVGELRLVACFFDETVFLVAFGEAFFTADALEAIFLLVAVTLVFVALVAFALVFVALVAEGLVFKGWVFEGWDANELDVALADGLEVFFVASFFAMGVLRRRCT